MAILTANNFRDLNRQSLGGIPEIPRIGRIIAPRGAPAKPETADAPQNIAQQGQIRDTSVEAARRTQIRTRSEAGPRPNPYTVPRKRVTFGFKVFMYGTAVFVEIIKYLCGWAGFGAVGTVVGLTLFGAIGYHKGLRFKDSRKVYFSVGTKSLLMAIPWLDLLLPLWVRVAYEIMEEIRQKDAEYNENVLGLKPRGIMKTARKTFSFATNVMNLTKGEIPTTPKTA